MHESHDNIRKLVGKAAKLFAEIDDWDAKGPVNLLDDGSSQSSQMEWPASDVGGFLEGFLEEILVRVEPVEDV